MKVLTNKELVQRATDTMHYFNTCYVMGGIGQQLTAYTRDILVKQYPFNTSHADMIPSDVNYLAFDCIGLIKSILWGWSGDYRLTHLGGAKYQGNNVPDVTAGYFFKNFCSEKHKDFNLSEMPIGAIVYMPGHIGIYAGQGMVIEANATTFDVAKTRLDFRGGIFQFTTNNQTFKPDSKTWQEWGLCDFVSYEFKNNSTVERTDKMFEYKGTKVVFKNKSLYESAWSKTACRKVSGTYYYYDNEIINNKRRITCAENRVGKLPTCYNVTGWVNYKI